VLVQTNYGGILTLGGATVGRSLGRYAYREEVEGASGINETKVETKAETKVETRIESGNEARSQANSEADDGPIMIVVATDAPLDTRQLERAARRALMGPARTGSFASNGSGDYVIAFTTSEDMRLPREGMEPQPAAALTDAAMSPLFAAVAEATEEAIYKAISEATTVVSARGTLEAIPRRDCALPGSVWDSPRKSFRGRSLSTMQRHLSCACHSCWPAHSTGC
jgi:D-aminopeptidase